MTAVGARRMLARTLPHPLYRLIRRRRVAALISGYSPRDVVHTYGGHRFTVRLADPLAEGWYDHDWPRLQEVALLARIGALRTGATVFDLGAHQGIVALMLAREVGPYGRVVAVEAEPHNAALARQNVERNHAANVVVVHAAITERSGTVTFSESLNGQVDEGTRLGNVKVPAVTIDELARRHGTPDLVFLDVEGHEGKALDGAADTLARGTASFFVEVHVGALVGASAADVVARFAGYRIFVADASRAEGAGDFVPFDGRLPQARFFLAAAPAA